MTSLRALNRYLALEARQQRRVRWRRLRPSSRGDATAPGLSHTDVELGGHLVAVTEDDAGIVELHEE